MVAITLVLPGRISLHTLSALFLWIIERITRIEAIRTLAAHAIVAIATSVTIGGFGASTFAQPPDQHDYALEKQFGRQFLYARSALFLAEDCTGVPAGTDFHAKEETIRWGGEVLVIPKGQAPWSGTSVLHSIANQCQHSANDTKSEMRQHAPQSYAKTQTMCAGELLRAVSSMRVGCYFLQQSLLEALPKTCPAAKPTPAPAPLRANANRSSLRCEYLGPRRRQWIRDFGSIGETRS